MRRPTIIEYTPVSILPEYGRGFFGHPGPLKLVGRLTGIHRNFESSGAMEP
jgi:hypothetical protein